MFRCQLCGVCTKTTSAFRLHSNLPKTRFACCFNDCIRAFSTYAALRQHINRQHADTRFAKSCSKFCEIGLTLHCGVQSCNITCTDTKSLISHLHQHIRDGMTVVCPTKLCNKRYRVKSSFSGYLSRDHTQWTSADLKRDLSDINYQQPTSLSDPSIDDDVSQPSSVILMTTQKIHYLILVHHFQC